MIRGAFIGIDRHADPFIGDLTGAARDATALWAVLSDSIADLDAPLITDDAATVVAMRDVLDATLGAADEDDVVILGFAGHGNPDSPTGAAFAVRPVPGTEPATGNRAAARHDRSMGGDERHA